MSYTVEVRANNPTVIHSLEYNRPVPSPIFKEWLQANQITYLVTNSGWDLKIPSMADPYFTTSFYFDEPDHAMLFKLTWV